MIKVKTSLFSILFLLLVFVHAELNSTFMDPNSKNLRDTTDSWPTYDNGVKYTVGGSTCMTTGEYAEDTSFVRQGITISLKRPVVLCRFNTNISRISIEKTEFIKRIDAGCCTRAVCPDGACKNSFEKNSFTRCMLNEHPFSDDCKRYVDTTYVESAYETVFSDSLIKTLDKSTSPKFVAKQSADVFVERDTLELYRKNGTLRYRGVVKVIDTLVTTKGFCFDKKGIKEIRRTNNAMSCE